MREVTLTELRRAHPESFYRQDWFARERFMGVYSTTARPEVPTASARGKVPTETRTLPRAVDLARAFLAYPEHPCWALYWWCADTDGKGQRVYVGGSCAGNGYRFEIHRHLTITEQWVTAA